jgi:DNA repair protein RecN (Recombination protein N)
MILQLSIKNLALIESASISFEKGLNILTGETGAGKTIILTALGLILGQRAQGNLLRASADKASVEATFELPSTSPVWQILDEAGIEADKNEPLIIRRELTREGKSRAQINCQAATLPILQKVGALLCDLIDQSSHQELKQTDHQRTLLDLYADLETELASYAASWEREKQLRATLQELLSANEKRDQEIEFLTYQLQELQETRLNEEASCFAEYQRLSQGHELLEKVHTLHAALCDSPQAVLSQLSRLRPLLDAAAKIDPALEEALPLFQEAVIPLTEVGRILSRSMDQEEADPKRLAHLEERLAKMHQLKRKIGKNTPEEIRAYEEELSLRLQKLSSLEQEIEELKSQIARVEKESSALALQLTEKRAAFAQKWQAELTSLLHTFNMPSAELRIELKPEARSLAGDESVQFSMRANRGEALLPVQACASGGELSRLLLAIKTTLAEKNRTPLLVFDEIDANVGGETAALIGERLSKLAKVRQLIAVTHFPQVARFADHHVGIHKSEVEGRTTTFTQTLSKTEREKELLRMLGGEKMLQK